MATIEGLTYKSPIRMDLGSQKGNSVAANIFNNQVPGLFVNDAGGFSGGACTYVCTSYVTEKSEPVWVKVMSGTEAGPYVLASYFVLVNYIDKNTSRTLTQSITKSSNIVTYSNANLSKRERYQTLGNTKQFGFYLFIGLSTNDVNKFNAKYKEISSFIKNTYLDSALLLTMKTVPAALKDLYDFMSLDSNGKSGPGFREIEGFAPERQKETQTTGKNPSSTASSNSTSSSKRSLTLPSVPASKPVTVKILDSRVMNNGSSSNAYNLNERRPYMQQQYFVYDSQKGTKQEIIRRHVFDVIPNSFEFSQLASTWNEVERSGNYPLVDWAKYNLTKVSFKFLVHGKRVDSSSSSLGTRNTTVNDGLDVSIDEQLSNLRAIGGAAEVIRIYNMNTLLTDSYRYPYLQKAGAIQWVISDMAVTATRLTPQGSGIATAEVTINLVEYPVVGRDIIALPPLGPSKPVIPGKKTDDTPGQYGLWVEETFTFPVDDPLQYTSPKSV